MSEQHDEEAQVCPDCGAKEYVAVPKWTVTPERASYEAVMRCRRCGHWEAGLAASRPEP